MSPNVRTARDVLADRIETWASTEDWHVYDYVDRLLTDLDAAGFVVIRDGSAVPVERIRALLNLLYPEEMTPTARRQFDHVLDEYNP